MSYLNYKTIGVACGIGLLAYCFYFDHKRRNAPDYKLKVILRREKERIAREKDEEVQLPDLNDKAAVEAFFIREIELGDELIQAGDLDRAVKHMSYAVALCPQPEQFLRYLRESLPTTAYSKLMDNLPIVNKKILESKDGLKPQIEEVE